ncbi:AAA family ATPase [Tuwongella immobilis]|uniref:AAA+ ATPase domain-containing protein n=1 Tax=Tuwongella immobilis TaxID=692036 RepID=A0A6C2YHS5_9BACT|nr:AAA family ATPase [Tuwongella immobilis]VIP00605.1 b family protein : Chaperone ClpB, putative OS=Microscilla marina ATCC 23134 GN=M23134_04617 PE=4 SV=1: AAA_2: ClpB_D2-small [Tuwongella immobilis]VTR96628.1 b family protein : Chaperone ClpB, putative OS=Microscilla marina ATCC 23134 GN=M23134_04617 PE=4 SV=1: AAA_2: ClpB_D2-small [Tuwongella immobilis]
MPTYRFDAVQWASQTGGIFVRLVDPGIFDGVGFGVTARDALADLRDRLEHAYEYDQPIVTPLTNLKRVRMKVAVRASYVVGNRVIPVQEPIPLRVDVIQADLDADRIHGFLPILGRVFQMERTETLRSVVERVVAQALERCDPAMIANALPPAEMQLIPFPVRIREGSPRRRFRFDELATVRSVADALTDPANRKQIPRALGSPTFHQDLAADLVKTSNNFVIVGAAGQGKTTQLLEAIGYTQSPQFLASVDQSPELIPAVDPNAPKLCRYWRTSAGRLIAGMKYLGQWEARVETIIAELGSVSGILIVDRLLDLLMTGGADETDSLAAFLLPYLQRGELRMICEATPAELDACRRLMPGFIDAFVERSVPEFNKSEAMEILRKILTPPPGNTTLQIAPELSDQLFQLVQRFEPDSVFPGAAVRLARDLLKGAVRSRASSLDGDDLIRFYRERTGLPDRFLRIDLPVTRQSLLSEFRASVIDQEPAIEAAADLVMRFKASLNDRQRPIAVMLFCGPTGVGKTELAQTLARCFFGHSERNRHDPGLIRLDMSEYTQFGSASRLLGIDGGEPSLLIRKVRQRAFRVILLDEFEKASPDLFDALMTLFDEGRLTDRYGRETSFRSTVILLTSNLGAGSGPSLGFATGTGGPDYVAAVRKAFRPEFFNRLDAIVPFAPLSPITVRRIAEKELAAIATREGIRDRHLTLHWHPAIIDRLTQIGFDLRFGARPMQRAIEREIVTPLANFLLTLPTLHHAHLTATLSPHSQVVFTL